jgi:Protein of unknown function (DUF4242)
MPIYVDYHPCAELSVTDIKRFLHAAQRGAVDEHGVCPVELFCGDAGHVFCVYAAHSEAAVQRRHRSLGLPCREVYLVAALPEAEDHKAGLQQVVARLEARLDEDVDPPVSDWLQQLV